MLTPLPSPNKNNRKCHKFYPIFKYMIIIHDASHYLLNAADIFGTAEVTNKGSPCLTV